MSDAPETISGSLTPARLVGRYVDDELFSIIAQCSAEGCDVQLAQFIFPAEGRAFIRPIMLAGGYEQGAEGVWTWSEAGHAAWQERIKARGHRPAMPDDYTANHTVATGALIRCARCGQLNWFLPLRENLTIRPVR